jgi:hypothetical protein
MIHAANSVRIASIHIADVCHLPGPPSFSLPTTFKGLQAFKSGHKKTLHCVVTSDKKRAPFASFCSVTTDYILSKSFQHPHVHDVSVRRKMAEN